MKKVETDKAAAAIGPYSQGVVVNGVVYTSGQIPADAKSGQVIGSSIEEQTEQVMKNLGAVLDAAGASYETVVKTTCFLSDMANFAAFNTVYAKYFPNKQAARSCVGAKELPKDILVEVEAIAVVS